MATWKWKMHEYINFHNGDFLSLGYITLEQEEFLDNIKDIVEYAKRNKLGCSENMNGDYILFKIEPGGNNHCWKYSRIWE